MEQYLQSPGYNPEWGQPVKGGTFVFGAQRDGTTFNLESQACCYTHGCYAGLPSNSLFRIDAWTGDLKAIEGDLVETWVMSDDGMTLTMQLREGVMFQPLHEKSPIPDEYNGGLISGDEFVCEDAKATYERYTNPPVWETGMSSEAAQLQHLDSMTCPDGPRGHTFVMDFSAPLGKTMGILSAGMPATILDKEWLAWTHDFGQREDRSFGRTEIPDNFYSMHGTGPFMTVDINLSVRTEWDANPNYWREGLPLLDRYENVMIKDIGTRFTALATGKIHYMGEGSWSMTPGQAQQAIRDFPDRIVINNQLNHWARTMYFGNKAPWNDVRARKAVSLALDRDEWLAFYRIPGYEGMKLAHTMAPGTFYAPTEEEIRTWPGYRQPKDEDIAEANRLMDEVMGVGNRPTSECTATTTNQSDIDACLFVMDNLSKNLGMEVESDFNEQAANTDRLTSGNFDFSISSATSSLIGDPDDDLYNNYIKGFISATYNTFMLERWAEQPEVMAEVEAMIRAQSAQLDPLKRKEMVRELDLKILNDVSAFVVVGWSLIFPGWRVELKGWRGYDLYSYTKYTMNERMWLAD
jgi:ABC-type transport system substrate-binding protein